MAELFQRDKSTISRHMKNIFEEGELSKGSVVANFATTAADGKTYHVDYYNLDVIISVGYRVKSLRGTQFRIWAKGTVSHTQALEKARAEYDKYKKKQDDVLSAVEKDFINSINSLEKIENRENSHND